MLTADGVLANLDQMVSIEVELKGKDRASVIGRSAVREAVLFKGTEEEARAELLRIARIMNAQGHTVVDQAKARVYHPAPEAEAGAARTDRDGAPIDPGKIPEAFHGEPSSIPIGMNPEDYPPAFRDGVLP
jgi:hypothetical protein